MPLTKNEKVELLRRVPLFAECSKAELIEVAISADEREAPEGDRLTEEGLPGKEFFVLVEGAVAVRRAILARVCLHASPNVQRHCSPP